VSAIGIMIGWLIAVNGGEDASGSNGATVTLQGMAAGTIVYVTFFEILQKEKSSNQNGFLQLGFIMLGFASMVALMSLGEKSLQFSYFTRLFHVTELFSNSVFLSFCSS